MISMKKILAFSIVLMLLMSSFIPAFAGKMANDVRKREFAGEMIIDDHSKYAEDVLKHDFSGPNSISELYSREFVANYKEIYEYYNEDASSTDEVVPVYVLVRITGNIALGGGRVSIYGGYIIRQDYGELALDMGYGIYVPKEDKLYCLDDAYNEEVEGIEKVFTEVGIGELIGDTDKDRKLTVKDVTLIQKFLAGICELEDDDIYAYIEGWSQLEYMSDFNRDGERDIKDATAIQKHLAGLE